LPKGITLHCNKHSLDNIKAAIKVNTELLDLYWQLGKKIIAKQNESNWGDGIIEQLSKDLTAVFPGIRGFSRANLFFIRKWFLFYQPISIVSQLVRQLGQNVGEQDYFLFVSQLVARIPWGHNREIISKCKDVEEAIYYAQETIKNNWSRLS
jgi:predicted nuclease of restriction endonuclease-like (RecB) superfamily